MAEPTQKVNLRDSLGRLAPVDPDELFVGFAPWAEDAGGFVRSVKEQLREAQGRRLTRTVWDSPEDRTARLLVDSTECASAADALQALADRLENNQLADLDAGPQGLGVAAFAHPKGTPPAVFFAWGNLCVSVVSFGHVEVDAVPFAQRLDARLRAWQIPERTTLSMEAAEPAAVRAGQPVPLDYRLSWSLGDDAYLKFRAYSATLALRDGQLVVVPAAAGEITVEGLVAEPGRETHGGRLVLSASA